MTGFGKAISVAVHRESRSPWLVAILAAACESGELTRKQIAAAGDFSLTSAYRVVDGGWVDADQMRGLIDNLPEPLALAVAEGLCRRFRVSPKEPELPPACMMSEVLAACGGMVDLAATIHAAHADHFVTVDEYAEIQRQVNELRAKLDRVEAGNVQGSQRRKTA